MKAVILLIIGVLAMNVDVHSQALYPQKKDKLWGFADEKGNMVIVAKYTAVGEFLSDFTWVNIGGKVKYEQCPEGGKWGVVDKTGKEVCPVIYDYVDLCANNRVAVNIGCSMKNMKIEGGQWGYVDLTTGQEVIPVQYTQVTAFSEDGVAWVEKGGSLQRKVWAITYKDTKGKIDYIERCFNVFEDFSIHDLFENENHAESWGLIDLDGNVIIDFQYNKVGDFHNNMAWAVQNGVYGMVDCIGKECISFQYAKLSDCYDNGVIWAWQKNDGSTAKIGLLKKDGQLLTEMKYSDAGHFTDDVAWVKIDGKYGLIDQNGKELTQMRYSKVDDFYNGVAVVWSELNAIGLVNKMGKEIARTMYQSTATKFGVCQFRTDKDGSGRIISWISHPQLGNTWIDQNGKVVIGGTKVMFKVTDVIPDALWDF